MRIPERWNLMFTDFLSDSFAFSDQYPEMSKMILSQKVCCNLMNEKEGCEKDGCTSNNKDVKLL